jgi:hypothetical protein
MKTSEDYSWEAGATVRVDLPLRRGLTGMSEVSGRVMGVDGSLDRGHQSAYRIEGGIRLDGRAGAIELFLAGEQRMDPFPIQFGSARWITAGFRVLSRTLD